MPDDDQQQQQTPPINLADPAALTAAYTEYLKYLQQVGNQRPAQAPVISQAQLDANRPTSLLGQLGEALGGGAPSDVPMTSDQRERAGLRGLFNFSRGLLGTGTFDSIGQALDRGLTEAERGQYNQEAQVAYGQAAAQDWQRQQMADRLAALKESIPLLQGIQRLNMPSLYGPGGGPGSQAGGGGVPGAPGAPGVATAFTGDKTKDLALIKQRESGGDYGIMNYVARADPSAIARGATASGAYQIVDSTWREGLQLAGLDPSKYPVHAKDAKPEVQDQVASALYDKYGTRPWDASKFGANWVQQPGGGYQLVKGAPYTPPPTQVARQPPATPAQPAPAPSGQAAALPPPPAPTAAYAPDSAQGVADQTERDLADPAKVAELRARARADVTPPSSVQTASASPTAPVTAGPQPPPGAVPQAPQPPAQQPPAEQPPAEQPKPTPYAYPGDVKATPEEYLTQHFQPASAEEIKRYAPGPDGDVAAAAADQVRRAQANVQVQQRLLDEIHHGVTQGDVSKQAAEVEKANTELDAAQNKYNDTVRALTSEGAKNLLTRDDAERTRVTGNYQKVQDRAQQDAQQAQTLANNIRLKEIEGEQARLTNKEQVQNKVNQDGLTQAAKDQIDARNLATQVEGFQSVVEHMGQPGWLQTTKNPFGQGESIAEKLGQMGWKVDDTGGYQMMQAGINEMIKSLRAGMPMGSLSDRDLDFIRRMGPSEWMDPDTRMAVTSYILQAARSKQQFSYEIQKELSRPNATLADAIEAADRKVKPFVPTVPADLTTHWTDQSPEWVQQRRQWAADNNIRPGTLYHLSNGDVLIAKRAPTTQAAPARPGPYVPRND